MYTFYKYFVYCTVYGITARKNACTCPGQMCPRPNHTAHEGDTNTVWMGVWMGNGKIPRICKVVGGNPVGHASIAFIWVVLVNSVWHTANLNFAFWKFLIFFFRKLCAICPLLNVQMQNTLTERANSLCEAEECGTGVWKRTLKGLPKFNPGSEACKI